MKGLGKILVGCSVMTAMLLLYVHERVEMIRVSYRMHRQSYELSQKAEAYRRLTFEVAQLRSPQHLEKRLEALSLPLALPKEIQVLEVPELARPREVGAIPFHASHGNFFDFLGQWIQVAQARTDQEKL